MQRAVYSETMYIVLLSTVNFKLTAQLVHLLHYPKKEVNFLHQIVHSQLSSPSRYHTFLMPFNEEKSLLIKKKSLNVNRIIATIRKQNKNHRALGKEER